MLPYGCRAVQWGSRRADGLVAGPGVGAAGPGAGPWGLRGGGAAWRAGGQSSVPHGFLGDALVVADDLGDDEVQQLLGEGGVEPGAFGELPEPGDLAGFAGGVGGRQVVLGFEVADLLGGFEALGEHVDDCGVDVVDAFAQPIQFGGDVRVRVARGHGRRA